MSRMPRLSWLKNQSRPRRLSSNRRERRLRCEPLEDRRMLAVFTVSNLDDAGTGSLRDAIAMANTAPGPDEINFSVEGEIDLTSELEITQSLTITGPGQDLLTIDAQQMSRVFNFSATTGDLTLEGLTQRR